ncbi:MAG: GNAT family N-acetyltransferase [Bacilli bacterium]|nr:GNAT family N-acetyltransferase [Bacilli bacterium]
MDIEIREAREDDFSRITKMIDENFNVVYVGSKKQDMITEYVAVVDEVVCGYFVFTRVRNMVCDFDYYLIDYVCTDIEYQGRGVATKMMEFAIDEAKRNHAKYIQLTSSDKRVIAHHVYEKLGYQKYDTNVFRRGLE